MLTKRFAYAALRLEGRDYLVGERFSVADGYLFTVTNWAKVVQFDLSAVAGAAGIPGPHRRPPGGAAGAARRRADRLSGAQE